MSTGPNNARFPRKYQGRNPPAAETSEPVMVRPDFLARARVVNGLADERGIKAELPQKFFGDLAAVWLASVDMQGGPGGQVPAVEQIRVGAPEQRPDPHH